MHYHTRHIEKQIGGFLKTFKIVLVVGARQVGKSSLLRHLFPSWKNITLDPINDIYNIKEDPDLFLDNFPSPLIIDEIQYAPELLPALKRRVDSNDARGQYILTGSQNILILKNVAESLAGRVGIIHLDSMTLQEISGTGTCDNFVLELFLNGNTNLNKEIEYSDKAKSIVDILWRGSLPGLLGIENAFVKPYLDSYIKTYIERDVRLIENISELSDFSKFTRLLCALTAQEINYSQLGREIGLSPNTAKRWLQILFHSYQWIELPPYYGNAIKRISQKPKGHITDTGIICSQLLITSPDSLASNPNFGSIFETWVVCELIKKSKFLSSQPSFYHWRTNGGAEVDIVFERDSQLFPIEIKLKSTLSGNDLRGLKSFLSDYKDKAKTAMIIYSGKECFKIHRDIWAVPWNVV